MSTQLTKTGRTESNPYRPDLPESFSDLSPALYEFLREAIETLREQHNYAQAGDSTFSWELLTRVDYEKLHTLGSHGRFYHPDYGIIQARYVQFRGLTKDVWLGAPVGFRTDANPALWIVTNDFAESNADLVLGIMGAYAVPPEDSYGWVITHGVNIQSVPIRKRTDLALFDKLTWPGTNALGVGSDGRVIGSLMKADGFVEIAAEPGDAGYELVASAPYGPNEEMRFTPIFWTTNFPSTMIASLTVSGTTLIAQAEFHKKNDLAGIIWESEDNWDHPLTGFETKKDYSNCVLNFAIVLSGSTPDLLNVNGPVLTIEGRTSGGVPKTWYVRLINYRTSGNDVNAQIVLDFDTIAGGFAMDDPVYPNDIARMFIGFTPLAFDGTDAPLAGGKVSAEMRISNISCTGTNSTMLVGNAQPIHALRMTNGYDDTYNLTPSRVIRNTEMLGYREWFNHYVGMSHYPKWNWDVGESRFVVEDATLPINGPTATWHKDLCERLHAKGYQYIASLSFELINSIAIDSWRQKDSVGNPALSGWSPPSTFLSPCKPEAIDYLTRTAHQFAQIAADAGQEVHFQVGEPWWWVRFDTLVPCFYDSNTTAKYLADTGLTAPVIGIMTETMTQPKIAFLNWLGDRLAEATAKVAAAAKLGHENAKTYVLVYLPQILNDTAPEMSRVNMPTGWAYPAFDILQLEDYDFVIENHPDKSAAGRALAESRLKYPRESQQYFSGFVLFAETEQIWEYTTNAIRQAYEFGIPQVFVWAYTQVMRDGYVFLLDPDSLFRRFEVLAGAVFIEAQGDSQARVSKWITALTDPLDFRVGVIEDSLITLQGSQGIGGLSARITAVESASETNATAILTESQQRTLVVDAINVRLSQLELASGQSEFVSTAVFTQLENRVQTLEDSITASGQNYGPRLDYLDGQVGSLNAWRTSAEAAIQGAADGFASIGTRITNLTFRDLSDTPDDYAGHAFEGFWVNAGGTALEYHKFLELPTGGAIGAILQKFGAGDGEASWSALTAGIVSVTPVGSIAATDVQAALSELDSEKQPNLVAPAQQIPSLNAPWINYGGGFGSVRYYKITEKVVVIEGLIQAPALSPTSGVVLFTLLPGYRPPDTVMFGTTNGGGAGRIDVLANGDVVMQSGNTAFTSLAGIVFVAA